ncbi:MAG: hypothetical protein CSA38_02710 [Flavobacteriales bacterium]|nr:MAG: hypothetical protein CSA38_02710 [Flavobacteriales bacterium]
MEVVKFGDLFKYQKKSKIKAGDGLELGKGKYPFFTSSNILSKSIDEFNFSSPSLIFGTGGKPSVHFCNQKFSVSTDCLVAQPIDEERVCPKYIYYFFSQNNLRLLEDGFKGAGLKHISRNYIDKIKIPLIPIETQKEIVSILDNATALRDKTKKVLDEYNTLAESIFLDMFGDPTKGNLEPIGNSITLSSGYAFKSTDFVEDGVPLIKIGTVNKGFFDLRNVSFLPINYIKKYKSWIVNPYDLLMSLTGTVGKNDYGNIEIASNDYDKYLLNQRVVKFNIIKNYNKAFFYHMFLHKAVKRKVTKLGRGVRQANISTIDIMKLKLIIPPIELQNEFAEKIALIEKQKDWAKQELKESEDLFNCLLQKAFKGELVS